MLRDILEGLAGVLRDEIGGTLSDDGIDVEIEPRLVMSPSEAICIDIYRGPDARDGQSAAFGDLSGFYILTVRARATVTDGNEAQDILTDMCDDTHDLCVAAALESDQSLDGWATQVVVDPDGFSGLLEFTTGSPAPMVGCTWRVLVGQALS